MNAEQQGPSVSSDAFDAFAAFQMSDEQLKDVEALKGAASILWDKINKYQNRHAALAKTSLEETVMWAVKAVSRK